MKLVIKMKLVIVVFVGLFVLNNAFAEGVKVKVDGMVCAFCAQGIKKKFIANPNVASCDVDLDNKLVTITMKPEKKMTDKEITDSIKESGYSVHRLERFN